MATKSDFTAEEWAKIIESAMLASIAITAAAPHGLWGILQEGMAAASGLASARSSSSSLVKDVVAALGTPEGRAIARDQFEARMGGATVADVVTRSIEELRAVSALLDQKAAADAPAFKQWLYDNAKRVAEASKEGGFLGVGGVRVTEKEKATLAQIADALGLPRGA